MRAKGKARGRAYLHRVLAAANLARSGGGSVRGRRGFSGSRIGRGTGVGRVLGSRDRYAAFRQRRVLIKSRIVRLAGKGMAGARAHLRYIQRDGVTREGHRASSTAPTPIRPTPRHFSTAKQAIGISSGSLSRPRTARSMTT